MTILRGSTWHGVPFSLAVIVVLAALILIVASRLRSNQLVAAAPALVLLSGSVAVFYSMRTVLATFEAIATTGRGGVGAISASLLEASAVLLPTLIAAGVAGCGMLFAGYRARTPAPSVASLFAAAEPESTEAKPAAATPPEIWVPAVFSLFVAAGLYTWNQWFLRWVLAASVGETGLTVEAVQTRSSFHSHLIPLVAISALGLSLLSLAWLLLRGLHHSGFPERFSRVGGLALVVLSLVGLVRCATESSFFLRIAETGSYVPAP